MAKTDWEKQAGGQSKLSRATRLLAKERFGFTPPKWLLAVFAVIAVLVAYQVVKVAVSTVTGTGDSGSSYDSGSGEYLGSVTPLPSAPPVQHFDDGIVAYPVQPRGASSTSFEGTGPAARQFSATRSLPFVIETTHTGDGPIRVTLVASDSSPVVVADLTGGREATAYVSAADVLPVEQVNVEAEPDDVWSVTLEPLVVVGGATVLGEQPTFGVGSGVVSVAASQPGTVVGLTCVQCPPEAVLVDMITGEVVAENLDEGAVFTLGFAQRLLRVDTISPDVAWVMMPAAS